MTTISKWLRRIGGGAATLLFAAGFAACETPGDSTSSTVTPGDPGTTSGDNDEVGTTQLALRFETLGDRQTRCGEVNGIHVAIRNSAGAVETCDAQWADASISGEMAGGATGEHLVADCLFVLAPGLWTVEAISAVDAEGDALACCTSEFQQQVNVEESETTEFGAEIQCETVQSGGLDIFAFPNRPPMINNVTISPSKFGETCAVQRMAAVSTDPEGDDVTYTWAVAEAPRGAVYAIATRGARAFFSTNTLGDYAILLTVADQSRSHWLEFPLHITSEGESCDDGLTPQERVDQAAGDDDDDDDNETDAGGDDADAGDDDADDDDAGDDDAGDDDADDDAGDDDADDDADDDDADDDADDDDADDDADDDDADDDDADEDTGPGDTGNGGQEVY